ncbi:unnamed protein product [Lupinus luteus]|uniref:cysteine dioxygenase n=1 Tax=Lupinus luteus TaxID=3873 RepID=A0AAV1WLH2_LUPLU
MKQGEDKVHVRKVGYVKRDTTKKRKPYHRVKKPPMFKTPRLLQKLFVSCRETFKGPATVPSPQDVNKLAHILDNMKPEDVGLSKDLQFFKPGGIVKENPRVTYTTIYQCDNFSLCIFFLPTNGVIHLHNHPRMIVFSKLILGETHIKSYDWVDLAVSHNMLQQPSKMRLAKLKANNVYKAPCDTSVLYPKKGGNMHEFTAITPCVVLDVTGPPYSKEDDKDCSYYKDHPYSDFPNIEIGEVKDENDYYGWLEEIEMSQNSQMDRIEYMGPPVIDHNIYFIP